ncbi:hypothetical protein D3C80_1940580 [compost metagenome]
MLNYILKKFLFLINRPSQPPDIHSDGYDPEKKNTQADYNTEDDPVINHGIVACRMSKEVLLV